MNNSNNEWSIVRGSNNNKQTTNNKKYVLSQLITKRIGIDDIIKRTDIIVNSVSILRHICEC
jgi:hypothetical protein